jgi:hypothetical protein
MDNGRRVVLYHPKYVEGFRSALREARADLHDMHFRHLCELADLRREIDTLRAELAHLRELRAAVLARQKAEAELAELYRERAIARARAAERDPNIPLH